MKVARIISSVLILIALSAVVAVPVRADQWNKRTIVTFSNPVELPGKLVLPAGKYVFKLADSMADRHIVQIWNEEESQILTTILAINNYRLEPTGETVMQFHERPGDRPQALRAWFYPGDNFGQEFAYPKERAVQLAQASHEAVPAEVAASQPSPEELKSVPLVAVTPSQKEEPLAQAIQTTPPQEKSAQEPTMLAEKEELPKTASLVPVAGLIGLISLSLALALRLFVKRSL